MENGEYISLVTEHDEDNEKILTINEYLTGEAAKERILRNKKLAEYLNVDEEDYYSMTDNMKKLLNLGMDVIAKYMDDDIREQVHNELAPCSDEEFLEKYMELHYEKYGEEFQVN